MGDVLVLCYHAASERWRAELSVHPDALAQQLEYLVRRGYRGATFTEAVTGPSTAKTLAVTFDDAFASVLDVAEPILSRLGIPGTVFTPTDFPGSGRPLAWPGIEEWLGGPHADELRPLSWTELRGLTDRGWEIGSHTRSHPRLTRLDDAALVRELVGSREACEAALSLRCDSIAYPYGDVDARVVEATRAAGYACGGALPMQPHGVRPLEWPRVGIYHGDTRWRFALKAAPAVRRVRALPQLGAIAGALGAVTRPRA